VLSCPFYGINPKSEYLILERIPTDSFVSSSSSRPIAATIAVVIHEGRVLLVRRKNPPDAGRWGFPGGKIEFGELIEAAAERELFEETAVRGEASRVFTAIDAFDHGVERAVQAHFILVAVLCRWVSGEPLAGHDALEAQWFDLCALDEASLAMSFGVANMAQQAAALEMSHNF
jgi:8-oxo-dGTP diphosphatase